MQEPGDVARLAREEAARVAKEELGRVTRDVERLSDGFLTQGGNRDKRISQLESDGRIHEGEIASLRASRHEHGNWLNRHNLEIDRLERTTLSLEMASDEHKKGIEEVKAMWQEMNTKAVAATASGRALFWLVTGVMSFIGSQLPAILKALKQ